MNTINVLDAGGAQVTILTPAEGRQPAANAQSIVLSTEDLAAINAISAKLGALGQKTMAGSTPVVISSDQSAVPVIKGQQLVSNCVISSGQSLSADVDLGVFRLVGLSIPATFEPTTLTFQSSFDNVTWNNVFTSAGAETSVTVGASRRVVLNPADFYGIRYIRVRGGTSSSPTTVAADRTVRLISEA